MADTPLNFVKHHLIEGDPIRPASTDLIAQTAHIPTRRAVPDGWRVLTGNSGYSLIARIAYRYEIEGE